MYTDSERAETFIRQAQDSLFLTFFHALSCYAIFHITCHTRWTQPQPLGGHQFCGERMLANVDMFDCENEQWVGNKCGQFDCKNEQWVGNKCGQFDCGNEQWVGDKCFACILIFLRCVYQLYLRTNIYISISYPTNVVILLFFYFFFIRYLTCQYGARHTCPLSKNQQQTKTINVPELCQDE